MRPPPTHIPENFSRTYQELLTLRRLAFGLKGIVETLRQEILQSGVVGMDETTVHVLDRTLEGKSHQGYFWTMGSKDAVVYRFDPGR